MSAQISQSQVLRLSTAVLVGCISLGLGGCQKTLKAPTLSTPLPSQEMVKTQFSIAGKIGVRTPQQNGSAFYAWTQVNNYFAIDLTGALGIGQTRIEGIPGKVTLTSAKTGTLQAASPEELLQQATGWQAPISYLVSWVQGKPASGSAQAQYDEQRRLKTLAEGGWQVQLSYDNADPLPQKLVMIQTLPQGENRVTLTIQSREDAAQP
ncbi:lipoprotein insertase outer membrane protein LolB [Alkanindiges illinoisensis]|uniref:Outer-membrane lipoprotein LolB n=1 Tax=Alkanindiges illinoisensis TaxID=197183 RepID=A0A4Y7XE78_9GAMM|nr:lipoprotein insertase outer membrane protein LolB [Alkanindiges illinoisensis]TEU30018.1 outer membrane lipoprotein LolB [Alkanindiges illinoisensis]